MMSVMNTKSTSNWTMIPQGTTKNQEVVELVLQLQIRNHNYSKRRKINSSFKDGIMIVMILW